MYIIRTKGNRGARSGKDMQRDVSKKTRGYLGTRVPEGARPAPHFQRCLPRHTERQIEDLMRECLHVDPWLRRLYRCGAESFLNGGERTTPPWLVRKGRAQLRRAWLAGFDAAAASSPSR